MITSIDKNMTGRTVADMDEFCQGKSHAEIMAFVCGYATCLRALNEVEMGTAPTFNLYAQMDRICVERRQA